MMEAASKGEGTKLDTTSLLQALTLDATLYCGEWTDHFSSHYQDVFFFSLDGVLVVTGILPLPTITPLLYRGCLLV